MATDQEKVNLAARMECRAHLARAVNALIHAQPLLDQLAEETDFKLRLQGRDALAIVNNMLAQFQHADDVRYAVLKRDRSADEFNQRAAGA